MNIDFELYRIFYTVANNGNITKASEELNISQPAISKSIKNLEEQLGGKLFVRTKRGVNLTEEGKEFYKYIKQAIEYINNIKVIIGEGAAVDVALLTECKVIIRGLRCLSDYDDEIQLHQTNKEISDGKINTVCFFADTEYQFVSSTKVRNVFALNKDISKYVEPEVQKKMIKKRGDFYV